MTPFIIGGALDIHLNYCSMLNEQKHQEFGLYNPNLDKDACGVGLIANFRAIRSHKLVQDALTMLENMEHRGACGYDKNTGDGAGVLVQIPDQFFRKEANKAAVVLPELYNYGVGMFFMPKESSEQQFCINNIVKVAEESAFEIVFQRIVSVDNSIIGQMAKSTEPDMLQIFFVPKKESLFYDLEKELYFLKTKILKTIYSFKPELVDDFYIASLSSKTIVYKGQLKATQLRHYFNDLSNPAFSSAIAIVHSRFSTNTLPKWKLAQPFRCIAHNGEINTIRGNINWWNARENFMLNSDIYKEKWTDAFPVCDPYLSDSGNFDNVIDFLIRTTRSIPHAMMMLIPEAWQNDQSMSDDKKGFYQYHDGIVEPWDGPAAICFTDGNLVGANLDRNGLRPLRYSITLDGFLVVASEEGCIELDQSKIVRKGRLEPGKMLLADLDEKRIVSDTEIKEIICGRFPYKNWIKSKSQHIVELTKEDKHLPIHSDLLKRQIAFGMGKEDVNLIIQSMAKNKKEAIGSMGADIPLAIFSKLPQHICNYFKQQFAQVTNPPIDPLREQFYMSLSTTIGGSSKILNVNENEASVIRFDSPVLDYNQFLTIGGMSSDSFRSMKLSTCFEKLDSLESRIKYLQETSKQAVVNGNNIIVISDAALSKSLLPMPSLLAVGAVHQYLIQEGLRKGTALVLETGDTWEVHHYACLLSYGADLIFPYLALETIHGLNKSNVKLELDEGNYIKAVNKGLLKVMSKLGVSTLQSYKGAQSFEAIGLSSEVIDCCFTKTVSRIEGMQFSQLEREVYSKHGKAYTTNDSLIPNKGIYQWNRNGEYHLFNPKSIHLLQHATRTGSYATFKKFSQEISNIEINTSTIRSFLGFKKTSSIDIHEVEPVEHILKRFASGAMSFGSISYEAHTTLAKAMNMIGAKSNSGEGGEDEARFKIKYKGENERSAIKQVASGRFGVTINYLTNADEIQIKIAQGAKPGEGGQLPGHKVDSHIAKVRHSTPGVTLISPPPHHDIYSIEDLAQLIFDLKNANPSARISVKLVSKTGVGVIASGVTKAHADHILISGHDGGTGASPLSSISHAGLPWELGLSETHHTLVANNLRDRVTLQADGQIRTGRDLAIATLLGAEEWGVATAALVVEGCILMRKCHLNTCPVGIATQDLELRSKFNGKVEHLVNYFQFMAEELREIMAELGFKTVNEMVGRADLLNVRTAKKHWKLENVDFTKLLFYAQPNEGYNAYKTKDQDHGLDNVLDRWLINKTKEAIIKSQDIHLDTNIKNTDRAVGTMLSNEIAKQYGSKGLKDYTISCNFKGTAGQSFGAFLVAGVQFNLEGSANDYFGKGLSGGRLIAHPDRKSIFSASKNTIVGNVCFYGATSGEGYINGKAGDRFAVRNSGAEIVVEGIGDNGCEYMTGGVVVVIGDYGRNLAAGMSGGLLYIYKPDLKQLELINREMVVLETCDNKDMESIQKLLESHFKHTLSSLALEILNDWYDLSRNFVKVIPQVCKNVSNNNFRGDNLSGLQAV